MIPSFDDEATNPDAGPVIPAECYTCARRRDPVTGALPAQFSPGILSEIGVYVCGRCCIVNGLAAPRR